MTFDLINPDLMLRFAINIAAMTLLVFGMFYSATATKSW